MNKITLQEAKDIKLMNRIDKKYIINFEQFCSLTNYIVENYYIVIDNEGKFLLPYKSIYFDTDIYDMYNDHKINKENRQKIRIREYESGEKFLEIKTKSKDSLTKKIRIPADNYSITEYKDWIIKNLHYDIDSLTEKIEISFYRITLININKTERITIDFNISFNNYITGIKNKIKDIVIEVKKLFEDNTEFEDILNNMDIYETKFSKYHIGINNTKEAHI